MEKIFNGRLTHFILPDLVILDINMPEMDGYETGRWLTATYPNIQILVLTMYDSRELAMIRLLLFGVRGFLKKDIDPAKLKDAIVTTGETGYYYPETKLVNLLQSGGDNVPLINNILLSAKELQLLTLACSDRTYKEIAQEMGGISVKTLTITGKRSLPNSMSKAGCRSPSMRWKME